MSNVNDTERDESDVTGATILTIVAATLAGMTYGMWQWDNELSDRADAYAATQDTAPRTEWTDARHADVIDHLQRIVDGSARGTIARLATQERIGRLQYALIQHRDDGPNETTIDAAEARAIGDHLAAIRDDPDTPAIIAEHIPDAADLLHDLRQERNSTRIWWATQARVGDRDWRNGIDNLRVLSHLGMALFGLGAILPAGWAFAEWLQLVLAYRRRPRADR